VCLIISNTTPVTIDIYVDFSRSQFAAAVLSEVNDVLDNVQRQQLTRFAESVSSGASSRSSQLESFQSRLTTL
jgi:hypothetical protein